MVMEGGEGKPPCGQKCYRAIHEVRVKGQKVKHISYTFKKGDMLYNIKFGSVTTNAQEELADEIMKSFNFKKNYKKGDTR